MGKFLTKVRSSQIRHPTQWRFSNEEWITEFKSHDSFDLEDMEIFRIGLWINEKLEYVRAKLLELPFANLPEMDLEAMIPSILNLNLFEIVEKMKDFHSAEKFISETLIQSKITSSNGAVVATPDEFITQIIDGARHAIDFLNSEFPNFETSDGQLAGPALFAVLINYEQYYDLYETVWMQAVWHGLALKISEKCDLLVPQSFASEVAYRVSGFRQKNLCNEIMGYSAMFWHSLHDREKSEVMKRYPVVMGDIESGFKIMRRDTDLDAMPYGMISSIIFEDPFLASLCSKPIQECPEVSVRTLFSAWCILRSLGECIQGAYSLPEYPVEDFSIILGFSVRIPKSTVSGLISEGCNISEAASETIVDAFTFKPRSRCSLWTKPLLISGNDIIPVWSPLLFGNPLRCFEFWIRQSNFDLSERGPEFEEYVRFSVAESAKSSLLKNDSFVHAGDFGVEVNGEYEEIDLLFRIGNLIFVGELKCLLFPSDPLDFHQHNETLRGAAEQAARKAAFVERNYTTIRECALELVEVDPNMVKIIPIVVTNTAFHVGFAINEIPVVDLIVIQRYFEGYWERMVELDSKSITKSVGEKIVFYESLAEAEKYAPLYFKTPPQIQHYVDSIEVRDIPIAALSPEHKPIVWRSLDVIVNATL